MEGRELRRCYTQVDFASMRTFRNSQHHPNMNNPTQARLRNNHMMSPKAKSKFPTMEIYRPPGQRGNDNGLAMAGGSGDGGIIAVSHSMSNVPAGPNGHHSVNSIHSRQLNVHAKEFIMSPSNSGNHHSPLQTSKSTGNMMSQHSIDSSSKPSAGILVTSSSKVAVNSSGNFTNSIKSAHVRWDDRRQTSGGSGVPGPGALQRSKSMTGGSMKTSSLAGSGGVSNSYGDLIVTPMGTMSRTSYTNIKHAMEGTAKLSSENVMGIVRILIDRAIEGRNYANIIASACEKIIDNDDTLMFFESLVNYCQFMLNKLKENSVNRRYNGIMGFICELYLTIKPKQLQGSLGGTNGASKEAAKKFMMSPCQCLLRLLVKCGHEVLHDPHLHLKPDQVECLFLTVMTVGRDLEREFPNGMDALLAAIRDSFLNNSKLSQIIKHKLLQIIETHASGWQLPAFTLMYYNAPTN